MGVRLLLFALGAALCLQLACSLPDGFVDEGIADIKSVTGAFAANPRNDDKPMLLLSSKEGLIMVLEDPDNDPSDMKQIANMEDKMCANGERGLQTIRPHPDFATNRYLYMYYTMNRGDCLEDATLGPRNRLSRFVVDSNSLMVDMDSEKIILTTSPTPKRVHNGGAIQFGNDGYMYVTIGDGGSREPAVSQDSGSLYGSILRLNDDGTVPDDNPFSNDDSVRCGDTGGLAPDGKKCSEIYAMGLRNPFRLVMDPNTKDKVKFHVGDVGASAWEEVSVGGTDYAGVNYGWPPMEGPCRKGGGHVDCPVNDDFLDPFYYYEHTSNSEGGALTGSAFVPEGLWPSKYKYMFIDFVYHEIYNLIEDEDRERRDANPPVPGYRNETFHEFPYMVDMFFGPYKNTQALYYVARSDGQNVRRIRYTSSSNRAPTADIDVRDTAVAIGETIAFDGSGSIDADGDELDYDWQFGDGGSSVEENPGHTYNEKGEFTVTLTVTDENGQRNQDFVEMVVGERPTAEMTSPAEGDEFYVGQVLQLQGSGVDSQGIDLDSSQLFWEVRQHHAEHFHPFLDRTAGNGFALFPAPEPEDFNAAKNSYLEIIMYAVDKDGLTTTISRRVNPKLVLVDVRSNHAGLKVLIDEFSVTTPGTITTWENHKLRLDAEDQWPFLFLAWEDDGSRQHEVLIPAASSTNPVVHASFLELVVPSDSIPLVAITRACSPTEQCSRCEGDCDIDDDCLGTLECFKKEGPGFPVPGCAGVDNSRTAWCVRFDVATIAPNILSPASPAPVLDPVTSSPVSSAPLATSAPVSPVSSAPLAANPITMPPVTVAPVEANGTTVSPITTAPVTRNPITATPVMVPVGFPVITPSVTGSNDEADAPSTPAPITPDTPAPFTADTPAPVTPGTPTPISPAPVNLSSPPTPEFMPLKQSAQKENPSSSNMVNCVNTLISAMLLALFNEI